MKRNILAPLVFCALACLSVACSGTNEQASNNTAPVAASNNAGSNNAAAPAAPAGATSTAEVAGATAPSPPAQVVRVGETEVKIRAGGRGVADVRLEIAPGYHINANPPTHKYLIPTQIEVVPGDNITAGQPVYPKALTKKFAFDPQPLAVYEDEAMIRLPLQVPARTPAGERNVPVKIRVQACDNQACYPPRNVEASIKIIVE